MNEISQLTGLLDTKWPHVGTMLVLATMSIGRICKAAVDGGGLVTICKAFLFGTNTPKPTDKEKIP